VSDGIAILSWYLVRQAHKLLKRSWSENTHSHPLYWVGNFDK